jgi:hypothetical protein
MNKKEIAGSIFLLAFLIIATIPYGNADIYQNSSIIISADIYVPTAKVNISPSNIDLGQVTKGYATDFKNITITNIGDLEVKINPVLEAGADNFFDYLEFNTASCSPTSTVWHNMSYYQNNNLSSTISPPTTIGGTDGEQYNVCIKLDLTNYQEQIITNSNLMTNLTIWVFPA